MVNGTRWGGRGSNPRPTDYESTALTDRATAPSAVGSAGVGALPGGVRRAPAGRGLAVRAAGSGGAGGVMAGLFVKMLRAHQWAYERSGGLVGHRLLFGNPTLLLRTVGRNTGQRRTSALTYARGGGDYLVT